MRTLLKSSNAGFLTLPLKVVDSLRTPSRTFDGIRMRVNTREGVSENAALEFQVVQCSDAFVVSAIFNFHFSANPLLNLSVNES